MRRSSSPGCAAPGCLSGSGTAPATPGRSPDTPSGWPATSRAGAEPVWYGGGKLAPDLTLPKLRRRWAGTAGDAGIEAGGQLTARERAAIWDHATRAAGDAAGRIRELAAAGDVAGAADAAWAAGGTLHAAAAALGSREVRQAASAYDRAARMPYGRIPAPTPAGNDLRRAARLLSAAAFTSRDRTLRQAALIARLAALAETVAELRLVQAHAAQAAAARNAAERLHAAGGGAGNLFVPRQGRYEDAADLAREAFPDRPRPGSFVGTADGQRDADDPARAARRGQARTSGSRGPGR